jgi:KaiC/GvpD/RAD55 family RecA-like ATPase
MALATASLEPDAIDPGTNVLVAGPVMTAKGSVLLRLLAGSDAAERGTVIATTRKSPDVIAQNYRALAGDVPDDRLAIVDCTGIAGLSSRTRRRHNRRSVSDPGDLTGIGIGLTEFMRSFYHRETTARVGVHSLSTMLMYTEFRRLFQFLHVVTGRIESSGFVGAFAVDDSAIGERETNILLQLFDTVVETRDGDAGAELRVRGTDAGSLGPRSWSPF